MTLPTRNASGTPTASQSAPPIQTHSTALTTAPLPAGTIPRPAQSCRPDASRSVPCEVRGWVVLHIRPPLAPIGDLADQGLDDGYEVGAELLSTLTVPLRLQGGRSTAPVVTTSASGRGPDLMSFTGSHEMPLIRITIDATRRSSRRRAQSDGRGPGRVQRNDPEPRADRLAGAAVRFEATIRSMRSSSACGRPFHRRHPITPPIASKVGLIRLPRSQASMRVLGRGSRNSTSTHREPAPAAGRWCGTGSRPGTCARPARGPGLRMILETARPSPASAPAPGTPPRTRPRHA